MTFENVAAAWHTYNAARPVELRVEFDEAVARKIFERMKTDFAGVIGAPRNKRIHEAGKWRDLEIPSFEASIAMIAIWNVCGPSIEKRIHAQSFSSRRGMGGHLAAKKCEAFVRREKDGDARYCWYFDIRQYYKHIDKRILLHRIENVFKDPRIVELFRTVIYSTPRGLPIGYPFSHALANLYLVPLYFLIMSVKGIAKAFVYMDNWNVFAPFKKPLHNALVLARRWLAGVGCSLKSDWQIFPTASRGVRICGIEIRANERSRLYRGIFHRILRTFDRYRKKPTERLYLSLMSRKGWLMAVNFENHEMFKVKGTYPWQKRK